jgi:quinolinate synthase
MDDFNQPIIDKINALRKERQAVILAHNYELGEVQDIADFVGDSLELSQKAAKVEARVIVFCGVHFMAETASILSPDMITAEQLITRKKELPQAAVVCYVNSTAEVKAESDVCCTSANAVKVVNSLAADEILFVPDQYLGYYVSTKTSKKMYFWPGYCPTHARIRPEDILRAKAEYPDAVVIVHPECRPETQAVADQVLSTGGMARFVLASNSKEVILGTEVGFIYRLRKENPLKKFIPATEQAVCPRMKLITLEKILWSLEAMAPEIKVPGNVRVRALKAVNRMLEIGS